LGKSLKQKKLEGRAFHGAWHPVPIAFAKKKLKLHYFKFLVSPEASGFIIYLTIFRNTTKLIYSFTNLQT
jgi:hypothetical protein